jgi:hypothetical protein
MSRLLAPALPAAFFNACRRQDVAPRRQILWVRVERQEMWLYREVRCRGWRRSERRFPRFAPVRRFIVSTSRVGTGQTANSLRTPLGLHRIARKIGGGWPIGTVFTGRQPVGLTWKGRPEAAIAHRILWLEGLEPGWNRGGNVDTFTRYIYLHGIGNETTLGKPASRGCIQLAAADLLPLFDRLPAGTLVWISDSGNGRVPGCVTAIQ